MFQHYALSPYALTCALLNRRTQARSTNSVAQTKCMYIYIYIYMYMYMYVLYIYIYIYIYVYMYVAVGAIKPRLIGNIQHKRYSELRR